MEIGSYIFQTPYSQPLQIGRPDPAMIKEKNEKIQEELNVQRQSSDQLITTETKSAQSLPAAKSSAPYQSDIGYEGAKLSVDGFAALSKEVQRVQNITTYVNNAADFETA